MNPEINEIICGDSLSVLKTMPDEFVDCVVTSPPYFCLRDYSIEGQIGLEKTFEEYLEKILLIISEVKRVLKKTGTLWWNHGDSYGGKFGEFGPKYNLKKYHNAEENEVPQRKHEAGGIEKCLMLQNFRLVQRMIDDQKWILRNIVIWHKPNVMPSSVKSRFTVDYEPIFFFTKSQKYWFETQYEEMITKENRPNGVVRNREYGYKSKENKNPQTYLKQDAIGKATYTGFNKRYIPPVKGRNKRCVWSINTKPLKESHPAAFPPDLIAPMILAGCPEKGIVLDPFMGSGTTALVAKNLGRNYLGIELNPKYIEMANQRLKQELLF